MRLNHKNLLKAYLKNLKKFCWLNPLGDVYISHKKLFQNILGGDSIGVTPVPIPNTEVKPNYVDGTAEETLWESRELPG